EVLLLHPREGAPGEWSVLIANAKKLRAGDVLEFADGTSVHIILKNSTIEAALHYAMLTNQLDLQVLDGNTILVYPNQPAKLKDYQEIVVRSFFLANAEAKTVANSIKTIIKTRDIVADEKLNMIIIRDSPEAVRMAEKLVALHDQPEPEVMLEVEILEIKRTRLLQLGIKWPDNLTLTTLPSTTAGQLTLSDLRRNINSRTLGASTLSATAKFGETDSDVNLLANPRIRARNHEKAKILIGERVPTITSTATSTYVSESVNYLDVGLKLDVEPTIFLDGDVAIKVSLEVSNIVSEAQTKSGTSVYRIGNRSASTVLRLKDGENQVLAGLINNEERRSASKLPGIGELPLVGRLFGSSDDNNEKTEIVLSITPRLIRNIQRPEATLAEFRAGTDGSMRVRPDSGGGLTVLPSSSAASGSSSSAGGSISNNSGNNAANNGNNANNGGSSGASGATPGLPSLAGTGATNNLETGVAAPAPTQPQLQWQGPATVKAGDAFAMQLVMRSDTAIASVPLTIKYDAKALQVTGVTEGDFLKQGGAQTSFSSKIDPSGLVIISGTRTSAGGATDSGAIATITFRALAASDATLVQLLDFTPVTANGLSPVTNKPAPFTLQ
ncbi:MAG: hypothetical protein HYZ45_04630, partial [Burkholderiales bacterium]|nr:hypothetical protein [Burkholderiales bacterium]